MIGKRKRCNMNVMHSYRRNPSWRSSGSVAARHRS